MDVVKRALGSVQSLPKPFKLVVSAIGAVLTILSFGFEVARFSLDALGRLQLAQQIASAVQKADWQGKIAQYIVNTPPALPWMVCIAGVSLVLTFLAATISLPKPSDKMDNASEAPEHSTRLSNTENEKAALESQLTSLRQQYDADLTHLRRARRAKTATRFPAIFCVNS